MWPDLYNLLLVLVCVSGLGWTLSVLSLTVLADSAEPLHSLQNFSFLVIHSSNSSQQMLSL